MVHQRWAKPFNENMAIHTSREAAAYISDERSPSKQMGTIQAMQGHYKKCPAYTYRTFLIIPFCFFIFQRGLLVPRF
jgi:hypothetical protein